LERGSCLLVTLLCVMGCSADPEHPRDASEIRCIRGTSIACACVDGRTGAQVCTAEGSFAACVCAPGADGADQLPARDASVDAPADGALDAPMGAAVDAARDDAVAAADAPIRTDATVAGPEGGERPQPPVQVPADAGKGDGSAALVACASLGTGTITDVAMSPDGTLLAVGEAGSTASVYHLPDLNRVFQVVPLTNTGNTSVGFSPDSNRLLVYDFEVKVVSAKDGTTISALDGASRSAVFSPDGAIVAATVRGVGGLGLWDARTGARLRMTSCPGAAAQFSSDGTTVRAGNGVCSVATGAMVGSIGGDGPITPDFKEGVVTLNGTVFAVRASDWVRVRALGTYPADSTQLVLSHDGAVFAIVGPKTITIRRFSDGSAVRTFDLPVDAAYPTAAAFSPDDRSVLSWYQDKTVRIHAIVTGDVATLEPQRGHTGTIQSLAYSADGALLASASFKLVDNYGDGTVRLWRTSDGRLLWTVPLNADGVGISPDGAVVAAMVGGDTKLLSATDGALLRTFTNTGVPFTNTGVIFSPDSHLVATSIPAEPGSTMRPPGFRLLNAADGTFVRDLKYDPGLYPSYLSTNRVLGQAEFSPDGQLFATGVYDPVNFRGIRLWRVSDGVELGGFQTMDHPFVAFADNDSVITASAKGASHQLTTERWRIRDGRLLWSATNDIASPTGVVGRFSYALDGGKLALFEDSDATWIRIFSGSDGHLLYALQGGDHYGVEMPFLSAYSRSGKYLATGGHQQSIRIWCVP
jgi:WD40 repeat protein